MRIGIVAIGRMKQGPERELVARYLDRAIATGKTLGLTNFAVSELTESRAGSSASRKIEEAKAIAGQLPAVDVLASRSALLDSDSLSPDDRTAARETRDLLARAAQIRDYLNQPLQVTGEATGTPGRTVPPQEAITGLSRLLT